jgi:hypothetical protein
MSPARLATLLLIALVIIAGAVLLARRNEGTVEPDKAPLLDGFDVAATTTVRITGAGGRPLVTLRRASGGWTLAERAGYPADAARVRGLLESLAALHSVERKTMNPARHAALGVEDTRAADAQGLRVDLESGAATRSLVVGRRAATQGSYVRLAGESQAHAALPELDLPREVPLWLDRTLLDVPAAAVAVIEVTPSSGPGYRLRRAKRGDPHLRLEDPPRGRSLYDEAIADPQAALIERFIIDDVHPAANSGSASASARFTTFDGLVVALAGRTTDSRCELRLHVAARPGTPAAGVVQADRLNARAGGRGFEVAAHRCGALFKPRDEFLK